MSQSTSHHGLCQVRFDTCSDLNLDSFCLFFFFTGNCRPLPCQNGGTCREVLVLGDFECQCPEGWTGKTCRLGKYELTTDLSWRVRFCVVNCYCVFIRVKQA